MKKQLLATAIITLPLLQGCLPLLVGGAAVAGVAATQERSLEASVADATIGTKVKSGLAKIDFGAVPSVDVSVYGGRVYLIGSAQDESIKQEVLHAASVTEGVVEVVDLIDIDETYLRRQYAYDAGLATKVRSRIIASFKINPNDLSVVVHKSHIYLIGMTTKESVRDQLLYIAQTTKGVTTVHDYISVQKPVVDANPTS